MESTADLRWRQTHHSFGTPGAHEIRARFYPGSQGYLESDAVQLEVRQPTGADAEAIAFFSSEDEFERLISDGVSRYCRGENERNCAEEVMQFVEQHGQSVYARRIVWELATAVSRGVVTVERSFRVPAYLCQLYMENWPDHPSVPGVVQTIGTTTCRSK